MRMRILKGGGLLVLVAALALPAGAAAASLETGVKAVRAHTVHADAALDRAVSLWKRDRDRAGNRQFVQNRRGLTRADAKARGLQRRASGDRGRAAIARATELVADLRDANIEKLSEALDETSGQVENRVAQAVLADTRGREKALAVLTALREGGVPEQAEAGILRAIAELSTERTGEIAEEIQALRGDDVSNAAKRKVSRAVSVAVNGQAVAAERLADLIADTEMPDAAKPGLQRAYDAVTKEQRAIAVGLANALDRLPAFVRSFVQEVVGQAQENAQGMRDNRPPPPTGGPEGNTGAPGETSGGAPDGTPSGQPGETPSPSPGDAHRP